MKRTLILSVALCLPLCFSFAQTTPSWLRQSAISPDGATVAFCYQGDIYTVPSEGGTATVLTSADCYDSSPIWTPDGSSIVFASDRSTSRDIWKIDARGGAPTRLTSYSGTETPLCVTDRYVYFTASVQVDPVYSGFPDEPQLYRVPLEGGAMSRVTSLPVRALSINALGVMIYEDFKGSENALRKHHTSSVTRDIWKFVPSDGKSDAVFEQLSTFKGENRNPVFASDGNTYYFLAENGTNFNVYRGSLDRKGEFVRITSLPVHPVRGLSVSDDGKILFSYNGDLYTCREGSVPEKLRISLYKDTKHQDAVWRNISSGATSLCVSPNGKEVAFIAHGDVYVTSVEFAGTHRITDTPQQERGLSFSADGRTLYYASERDGEWGIWKSSLTRPKDKYFTYSYSVKEERFTPAGETCFQPAVSPDGKWVAYLRDRTTLVIRSTSNSCEKVLLEDVNYSYTDGDLEFAWSPDSRYILSTYMGEGGWNNEDVALIDIKKGSVTNLTQSGYSDGNFAWGMGGAALTWTSDKAGYRSHGSWGADKDIYVMFLDPAAWTKFSLDKEGQSIEKLLGGKKVDAQKDTAKTDSPSKTEKPEFDLAGREDRIARLTKLSGTIGGQFLSNDGESLYYIQDGKLYRLSIRDGENKVLCPNARGGFDVDREGKNIFLFDAGKICKIELSSGKKTTVSFSADYQYRPAQEREYIFNHCWKQVQEKFYDRAMHGVDWEAMRENYSAFLPYIDNNYDFADLLSEMLGELNASHTGAGYRNPSKLNTGHIGVLWDEDYAGKGLRIVELLPGSVLKKACSDVVAGDVVLSVDGVAVGEGVQWYEAFSMKSGRRVCLEIKGKDKPVFVKASSNDTDGMYLRWVRRNENYVTEKTGGKVGYVHIRKMNSDSFRELYSKVLGKFRGCEALIVDTRHNGGGWLHDDIATFLGGREYARFTPRGRYIGSDPYNKWRKPSCMVMSEDNYSDASGTPYVYRTLGIGKLIGAPVPGTATSVWWETQIDPSLYFGIPEVGKTGIQGRYLENSQIEPDILVYNDPASTVSGKDPQLDAAIAEMLSEIKNQTMP